MRFGSSKVLEHDELLMSAGRKDEKEKNWESARHDERKLERVLENQTVPKSRKKQWIGGGGQQPP